MTKLKVGDKVRFVEDYMDYKKGDIVEVEGFWSEGINYVGKGNSTGCYFSRVELVEKKLTKNQRITALENEVAELRPLKQEVAELKLIVHELRGKKSIEPSAPSTVEAIIEFEGKQYRKVDREAKVGDVVIITKENETSDAFKINKPYKVLTDIEIRSDHPEYGYATYPVYTTLTDVRTPKTVKVYELIESKTITQNQQRAAIIEKAKSFIEDLKNVTSGITKRKGYLCSSMHLSDAEFVVNEEKRTIVCLLKEQIGGGLSAKGIAKCNPNDVFNEHIGKAIALGRALGIDVRDFERAVQPTEFVSGQIIKGEHLEFLGEHQLNKVENGRAYFEHNGETEFHWSRSLKEGLLCITNDTEAIY